MPSADILKLYRDLGGKILTIGSDSHRPEQLGAYIEETKELLKDIGFQYFCTYENMKPAFHRLSRKDVRLLEQGRIIERGTHEQLLEEKGRYYQLYTGNKISV